MSTKYCSRCLDRETHDCTIAVFLRTSLLCCIIKEGLKLSSYSTSTR